MAELVASETVRYTFPTLLGATLALLTVLEDARTTQRAYRFTGLSPHTILRSGIFLEGDVADISERVSSISGAVRHDS